MSWAQVVLQKRTSEDKKEYKMQALSSFWLEGVPDARSCNHPKEVSEGQEFWRGCWLLAHALRLADPRLWWTKNPQPRSTSEWSQHCQPCNCNLCLEHVLLRWLKSNLLPYQVLVDRNLCLPAEHAKCRWSSICVYSRGCSDQGLELAQRNSPTFLHSQSCYCHNHTQISISKYV